LGSVCTVQRGSSPRPIKDPRFFDGGTIPWIKIADATKSGKYLYDTKQKVNAFGASFSRKLPPNSLILAASGTLGCVQLLGVEGCIHDGWLHLYDFEGLDHEFAYYWLKANVHLSSDAAYGAAIQNINTELLRSFPIDLPPLPVQKRIAAILSAYDDLIEVNTRRIAILEEMARRIYEEWFGYATRVSYDTVSEDAQCALQPLDALATDKRDSVIPSELAPDTLYVGLEHLSRRSFTLVDHGAVEAVSSTKLTFKRGDVLFGKIRPNFHKIAFAPGRGVCSSDTIVLRPKQPQWGPLILLCAFSDRFVEHATATSNGTKMPRANWNVLRRYAVPKVTTEDLETFNGAVLPMIQLTATLAQQNANLRAQRDLILPRLVSGKLDVSGLDTVEKELAHA
tara:strand:+ start:14019 stop:15206 length:1188 start_codon:yes stop_codon:yes gene_type:complete